MIPRLDAFLPEYDVVSTHVTTVRAPAARVWDALMKLDTAASPVIRILFALRGLPRAALRFAGFHRMGFTALVIEAPRTHVLGIIGRFWTISGGLRRFDAAEFASFSEAGYAKAVWGFALEPVGGATRLVTETRVRCLDPASRRRFRVYWFFVGPFSAWIRRDVLRLVKRAAEAPSG